MNNRLSEPEWYRYYRCQHFGFHPTQWMAWPEGWMMCRNPLPGEHPYDLKQPEDTDLRDVPRSSTEQPPPQRRERKEPEKLEQPKGLDLQNPT